MLDLARRGRSALLVAATGAGKTLAGFLPTICEFAEQPAEGLHTLYVSPLKALAVDVARNAECQKAGAGGFTARRRFTLLFSPPDTASSRRRSGSLA